MSNADTVLALLEAYQHQDRAAAEALVADDLRFTSPYDDHIDRAAYFATCFPTADTSGGSHTLHAVDIGDDGVFLMYESRRPGDERWFRNCEFHTVRDGQVHEIEVFFGGPPLD